MEANYNIVLVLPHINMNPPRAYMFSPSWTPLPPPSLYHPSRSSQCTSPKDPVSNLDWRFVSYMISYMFQCHSPKSSHPLPLPQSPKDCSIHLCLFCCLTYRVIVTISNRVLLNILFQDSLHWQALYSTPVGTTLAFGLYSQFSVSPMNEVHFPVVDWEPGSAKPGRTLLFQPPTHLLHVIPS